MLSEDAAGKYLQSEEMVENIVENFRSTREFTIRAIHLAQEEEDFPLEDTLIGFKDHLDKSIWMLQAFLGKETLEDDPNFEEDEIKSAKNS